MKKQSIDRLNKFGRFIGTNYLKAVFDNKEIKFTSSKADSSIEHFAWALSVLPKFCGRKWLYNEDGFPCLISYPELNSLTAAALYFNLTADQLFHLFVPGYQDPLIGEHLFDNTDPCDLALNIDRFTSQFEPEEDYHSGPKKEKIKIKKFNHLKAA